MVQIKSPPSGGASVLSRKGDTGRTLAYVGSRTTTERNARGQGLLVCSFDGEGDWAELQTMTGLRNPSYLCLHPVLPVLYAVHGDFAEISTFEVAGDGSLTKIEEQSTHGRNPVHLAPTRSLRWLLVANYATGNVVSMRISGDGRLGAVAQSLSLPGERGPLPSQDGSHPHQICLSPEGRFALVPDKGLDAVFTLSVNEDTGYLQVVSKLVMPPGCGPRHMVFHPHRPLAYIVGELDRTVTVASYDASTGALSRGEAVSSVPVDFDGGSAAGILFDRVFSHLFVSNRGHDSVAQYSVDDQGKLSPPLWIATGKTPRFITQLPGSSDLVIACEDGDTIQLLRAGEEVAHELIRTGSPVCVIFRKENQ
jgi:6-phosphogluconolactonase (cycloisomerase 2 family)